MNTDVRARQATLFPPSIQEKFEKFHQENPDVYRLLVKLARQVKASGRRHYGIGALFEQVRWHYAIERKGQDGEFKLANDLRSRYSRLIMAQEPDLAGFFDTRQLRTQ